MHREDTIAALATPPGAGALAVIRLSGPHAIEIAGKIFKGHQSLESAPPGRVLLGKMMHRGKLLDEVLCTVFRAPRSYTGENVVEISGHGGIVAATSLLRALLESGARPADPGEFTQRAFLNGKMDLTRAEAVMDLISARGEASAHAAAAQLEGRLGHAIEKLREETLTALAHLEAFIDFPDEGIDPESGAALRQRLDALQTSIKRLLSTADQGRMLREGVRLVIYGKPNAGKSSLLNLLVGYDRAMVSEIPGTTRDSIEENLTLRGMPFRIVDTAGLRESDDPLEIEGMRRTQRHLEQADVMLRVMDASTWNGKTPDPLPHEIIILNKSDLWGGGEIPEGTTPLCCLDGRGLDALVAAIMKCVRPDSLGRLDESVAINARHQHCLLRASDFLGEAMRSLERNDAPELTSIELRSALASLGEIVGAVDTEEILGKIFSTFCIGK